MSRSVSCHTLSTRLLGDSFVAFISYCDDDGDDDDDYDYNSNRNSDYDDYDDNNSNSNSNRNSDYDDCDNYDDDCNLLTVIITIGGIDNDCDILVPFQ